MENMTSKSLSKDSFIVYVKTGFILNTKEVIHLLSLNFHFGKWTSSTTKMSDSKCEKSETGISEGP